MHSRKQCARKRHRPPISTTHIEIAARCLSFEGAARTANNTTAGSRTVAKFKCPNGPDHIWRPRIDNLVAGKGCPFCANRRVSVTNSLATRSKDLARLLHKDNELSAAEIIATSKSTVCQWLCSCGKPYFRTPRNMIKVGVGCIACRRKSRRQLLDNRLERRLEATCELGANSDDGTSKTESKLQQNLSVDDERCIGQLQQNRTMYISLPSASKTLFLPQQCEQEQSANHDGIRSEMLVLEQSLLELNRLTRQRSSLDYEENEAPDDVGNLFRQQGDSSNTRWMPVRLLSDPEN